MPGRATLITIPAQWVLPDTRGAAGIVVNLSEFRLYYFFMAGRSRFVATFPIGIGDEGRRTPLGSYRVTDKLEHPRWRPPPSILAERPSLPRVVPPGRDNPLGTHALRLSSGPVLIHGTNRPFGVGRKVSHGCIHLYPEDILVLFGMAPRGAKVTIIRQPVKIGKRHGRIYVEVHDDDDFLGDYRQEAHRLLKSKRLAGQVSMEKVDTALEVRDGIPVDVTGRTR